MPANHLTDRDYELLSAYIDGELSATERANIERRLQSDAIWQQEYEALRTTTQLVRNLPTLQAPRDFTLTPQMAQAARRITPLPKRRRTNYTPWAVLVAAVFVMVIGAAILFSQRPAPRSESDNTQQVVAAAPTSVPTQAETPLALAPPLAASTMTATASPMPTALPTQAIERSGATTMPPAPSDAGDVTAVAMEDMAQTTMQEAENADGELGNAEAMDDVSTFAIPQQPPEAAAAPTEGVGVQTQSAAGAGGGIAPDQDAAAAEESVQEPRLDNNTLDPTTFLRTLLNILISLLTQLSGLR